jgi:cell pole-organizing protein PopZ
MEEILASIRRIISEDGEAGKEPPAMPAAAPAAVLPPEPAKPAEKPAEILELTEMVSDDGKVTNLSAQAAAPTPPPAPSSSPEPAPPPAASTASGEGLISATTAAAAASSLASLQAMAKEPETEPSAPPRSLALGEGALTIEDIVREELRPILQSWLDENLPGMVERLVQKEIKRITRNVDGS